MSAGDAENHAAEVEAWQQDRIDRLKLPGSWLSLAGLSWLEEGASACGSDPESAVPLPASVPAHVGTFHRAGTEVEFEAAAGVEVTSLGKKMTRIPLVADVDGAPTLLEVGSVTFHLIRREDRFGVRIKDSRNEVLLGFQGIDTYPITAKWRVEARFIPYKPAKTLPIPTALGTISDEMSPGTVEFEHQGETYRLDALEGPDDTQLFVIFGDETNSKATYGGGRFLYADLAADATTVLDFNKSYNPPCAFTPYATCPLPPQQNRLPFAILAGEKSYGDGHH